MAKGGTLANIGQALAGYGSALSGNPMYLQNSLLLRQAQQQQAEQEAAKQREQMQGQAVRSMLMNTPLEGTGTPQAKAFQVNGRAVGQNIAAGPQLTGTNARGLMMQQALGPAFDNVFMGQKAQQLISQIFPQGFTGTLGPDQTAYMNGKKVAEGQPGPGRAASFVTLGNGRETKTFNASDPAQLADIGRLTGSGWTEVKTPSTSVNVNTAENKGQIAMTTGAVDGYNAAQKAARQAAARGQMLNMFEEGMKYFTPGALPDQRISAGKALAAIGIKTEGLAQGQLMQSLQKRIELANTPKGEGTITGPERELVRDANNILGSDPEGAAMLIEATRQLDRYDQAVFDAYKASARANGGVPNPLDVEDRIAQIGPALSPEVAARLMSVGADRAPLPAQPGSAQAATGAVDYNSLPVGSVIQDAQGFWEKTAQGWRPKK